MYEYCSYFPLQEGWRIPTFAKMQILGRISQNSHATVTPRGIILKSWRESTVVNAVWQVSVIFTALPWRGLMEREACTLCQGKLPGDPCCSLMPVLNWIAMKWCGKSHVNSTPPWLCPIGKSFPISLSIKKKKKKKLALVFSFTTVLFHTHNRALCWAFLLAYPPWWKDKPKMEVNTGKIKHREMQMILFYCNEKQRDCCSPFLQEAVLVYSQEFPSLLKKQICRMNFLAVWNKGIRFYPPCMNK